MNLLSLLAQAAESVPPSDWPRSFALVGIAFSGAWVLVTFLKY